MRPLPVNKGVIVRGSWQIGSGSKEYGTDRPASSGSAFSSKAIHTALKWYTWKRFIDENPRFALKNAPEHLPKFPTLHAGAKFGSAGTASPLSPIDTPI